MSSVKELRSSAKDLYIILTLITIMHLGPLVMESAGGPAPSRGLTERPLREIREMGMVRSCGRKLRMCPPRISSRRRAALPPMLPLTSASPREGG